MIDYTGNQTGWLLIHENPKLFEDTLKECVRSGMTKTEATNFMRGVLNSKAYDAVIMIRGSSLEKHLAYLGAQSYAESSESRNDAKNLVDSNWESYKAETKGKTKRPTASRNASSGSIRALANEIADLMYYSDDRKYGHFATWDDGIERIADLLKTQSGRDELTSYMRRRIDQDSFSSDDADAAEDLIEEIRSLNQKKSGAGTKRGSKQSKPQASRNRCGSKPSKSANRSGSRNKGARR